MCKPLIINVKQETEVGYKLQHYGDNKREITVWSFSRG